MTGIILSHVKDLGISHKSNEKLKYFKQTGDMTTFLFWKYLSGYRVKY